MFKFPVDVANDAGLTDFDRTELNVLRHAYESGGVDCLDKALAALADANPIQYVRLMAALFPDAARETIRDVVAEAGLTIEDINGMIRKAEISRKIH